MSEQSITDPDLHVAAAELGVAREDIPQFCKTLIDLGRSPIEPALTSNHLGA